MLNRLFLTLTLLLSTLSLSAQELASLHSFDGSQPLPTFMGEQVPASFFTRDLTDSYQGRRNYAGHIEINLATDGKGLQRPVFTAYLINETDVINDMVISAVSEKETKNFLIRVQPFDYLAVDLLPLRRFDHAMFLSLNNFSVQFEGLVGADRAPITDLEVLQPIYDAPASRLSCYDQTVFYKARISNRSPSTPGSVTAWIDVNANVVWGTLFLEVEYPVEGMVFHAPKDPRPSCNESNPDFLTYSSTSGRTIEWYNMVAEYQSSFATGRATCQAPLISSPFNSSSCYVEDADNPGTYLQPLTPARWYVTIIPNILL